ncbi:MAG TPA: helix-turn-helix transcriptional regulator [Rhodothermales bacterium]|nr:helix-turn-helix transcriptional regulator [Rhodothermales bacterium]
MERRSIRLNNTRSRQLDGRDRPSSPAGALLRYWRNARHMSQLALALEAEVSPRHVSFVETGRSQPSREMILLLAGTLDIPLREQNALLLAAGYAPIYEEAPPDLASDKLAPVRAALDAILAHQEPYPAVVMNRHWDILLTNRAAERFFGMLLEGTTWEGSPNVVRMMFNPDALRPFVKNWKAVARTLIQRIHREAVGGVLDDTTTALLEEVLALPGVPATWKTPNADQPLSPVIPMTFEKDDRVFNFFSTVTTFGTPQDVLLQEIRIESFFPHDAETRRQAEALG